MAHRYGHRLEHAAARLRGEGGAVANTQVTAVIRQHHHHQLRPRRSSAAWKSGDATALIPSGTTLTFSIPPENTNFLEPTTGTDLSSDGNPFTYAYEFGDSKDADLQHAARHARSTAPPCRAPPRPPPPARTSWPISPRAPATPAMSPAAGPASNSGYPSAFGYINPTQQGSVYIAPNMTFDFTEIQYEGKTVAQAEADWAAQFSAIDGQCRRHADRRLADPRLRRRGVEHHDQFAHRIAVHHADVHGLHRAGLQRRL